VRVVKQYPASPATFRPARRPSTPPHRRGRSRPSPGPRLAWRIDARRAGKVPSKQGVAGARPGTGRTRNEMVRYVMMGSFFLPPRRHDRCAPSRPESHQPSTGSSRRRLLTATIGEFLPQRRQASSPRCTHATQARSRQSWAARSYAMVPAAWSAAVAGCTHPFDGDGMITGPAL